MTHDTGDNHAVAPQLRLVPPPPALLHEPHEPEHAVATEPEHAPPPADALSLEAEILALRRMLAWALTAAEAEQPRDAFLAATRLVDAIVRAVRAQCALQGEPIDPVQSAMLEALAELGLGM